MNRRDMISLAALGLIGCATGKATKPPVEPSPSPVPELKCIVCGIKLDHYNWYGDEGPFCDPHLDERIAKDRPKKGQRARLLWRQYTNDPRWEDTSCWDWIA